MELQTSTCELLWVLGLSMVLRKSSQCLNRGAVSLIPVLSFICLSAGLFISFVFLVCFIHVFIFVCGAKD